MKLFFKKFHRDESGAVTAEWVVLTALAVTLLGAGYGSMETGTEELAGATESYMQDFEH